MDPRPNKRFAGGMAVLGLALFVVLVLLVVAVYGLDWLVRTGRATWFSEIDSGSFIC